VFKELYIDNYKCLVNFHYEPTAMQLLVGGNGSGKSSVFDVLEKLKALITRGVTVAEAFPTSTLTVWDQRSVQKFEFNLSGHGGTYLYALEIQHDRSKLTKNHIKYESVMFNDMLIYEFDGADVHLFSDSGAEGPVYPYDPFRSMISMIPERPQTQLLSWFRNRIERVYIFSPDPIRMEANSDSELEWPDRGLHQLSSWLRHLAQETTNLPGELQKRLSDGALPGLKQLKFEKVSESMRTLKLEFELEPAVPNGKGSKPYVLSFDQLSDGQRNLIALYTILCATFGPETTICLDEPDNFVALREIQPWLTAISDRVQDTGGQCLLISHHPEMMNYLAADRGVVLSRDDGGPTRIKRFEWSKDESIAPADLVLRGWE
jgi:energy-coupling factor transporter ATP-binding protein EcfA2